MSLGVPHEACGLRLCKMFGERLRLCESVRFIDGWKAVDTVLRRARVSGAVEVGEGVSLETYWADILNDSGNIISHAALDQGSFNSLKNHWMRCKYTEDA